MIVLRRKLKIHFSQNQLSIKCTNIGKWLGTGNKRSLLNCVLGVLVCLRSLRVYVLACLRTWRACVLDVLACVRACYDEMFYFLTCLHTWRAFLSFLLHISILTFKNSYSKKFACFVRLNIFLIYILIPTYETIWSQLKGNRKVNVYII